MTVNERFETIIRVLFGGNKRAFALHVGISPTVVENVVGTRKGKPSFDVLEKVCANANISAEWLLLGKGEMLMDMFEIRKPMRFSSDPAYYENINHETPTPDEEPQPANTDFSQFINYGKGNTCAFDARNRRNKAERLVFQQHFGGLYRFYS